MIWGLGRLKLLDRSLKRQSHPVPFADLKNSDPSMQGTAAWALGEMGVPEAVPHLKTLQKETGMIKLFINDKFSGKTFGSMG